MFDALSDKLQHALGDLRGRGVLDEEAISRAMREIRLALLEADVNFKVVKGFVARVRERAVGADVTKSLTPGQEVVRIVHEELTSLMGSGDSKLAFASRPPTVILLAGLQGAGKTTAAAKLALLLRKEGHSPALVAADLARPAAVEQLEQLGRELRIPVFTGGDPVEAVTTGIDQARNQGKDVVILDTAGRLHVDEALMEELAAVRNASRPTNVLLVLDAMTGQEAVSVAEAFQERVTFDDFLASYKMLRRMDPLKGVLSMLPGVGKQLQGLDVNEKDMGRVEAIVLSMTPQERRLPHLIDGSRRKRIAAGSGTSVQQVNQLLSARKQMQKMMKQMKKGKMPGLPPELLQQAQQQQRR